MTNQSEVKSEQKMRLSSEQSLELVSVVKETIRNCELIFLLTRQAKNIKTLPDVQKVGTDLVYRSSKKYLSGDPISLNSCPKTYARPPFGVVRTFFLMDDALMYSCV